jgi:hypothetical protein
MPALSNTRHEAFARELAKGSSKASAYETAGFAPDTSNASKLTANHRVAARIEELQQGAVDRVQMTVGDLVGRADELRQLAIEYKQISAGVAAVKELGILTGLRIDRREVGGPGEFERLSDAELMKLIQGSVEQVELPDDGLARKRPNAEEPTVGRDRYPATTVALETEIPPDLAKSTPSATLDDHLRAFGLTAGMEDGVVVVKCTNGMHCKYNARYFVPVVFPGLEQATISARLIEPGRGEVRIGAQCYPVTIAVMDIDVEPAPPGAAAPGGSGDRAAERRAGKQRRTKS